MAISNTNHCWGARNHEKSNRKVGKRKLELKPFEDELALSTMMQIKLWGWHTGAYVLTGAKESKQARIKFIFGFDCKGIHSNLPHDQVDKIFDNLESGLKDLPQGERITFHLAAFSSDRERQEQLARLVEDAPSTELKFLLTGERARIQELAKRGLREPKFLKLYASYTIEPGAQGTSDWIEKLLARGISFWRRFKGESQEFHQQQLKDIAEKAFKDGWQRWFNLLTNSMGLQVRPMTEIELWEILWQRFNTTKPEPIPQLLILDEKGLREEINSEVHPTTLLIAQSQPFADREWVKNNNRYVGALTFYQNLVAGPISCLNCAISGIL